MDVEDYESSQRAWEEYQATQNDKSYKPGMEIASVVIMDAFANGIRDRLDGELMRSGPVNIPTFGPGGGLLPTDPALRKEIPIGTGVLDYFSAALIEVARCSKAGNDQHNKGQPLHWARGKSMDHYDTLQRHLLERGTMDTDGIPHTAKAAWRVLAMLQEECEARGAPVSRASRFTAEAKE